jgi:hypothetical protein
MKEVKILKKSLLYYNKICIYLKWSRKSKNKNENSCRNFMKNKFNKKNKLLTDYHSVKTSCRDIKLYRSSLTKQ